MQIFLKRIRADSGSALFGQFGINEPLKIADTLQLENFDTLEAYAEVFLHGHDKVYMAKGIPTGNVACHGRVGELPLIKPECAKNHGFQLL